MEKNYRKKAPVSMICFVISAILLIWSFFLPPAGEIHPSVMQSVAILVFSAGIVDGLNSGRVIKFQHKDTTLYIGDKE